MITFMDNKYLVEKHQGFCAQKKSEIGLFSPLISSKWSPMTLKACSSVFLVLLWDDVDGKKNINNSLLNFVYYCLKPSVLYFIRK